VDVATTVYRIYDHESLMPGNRGFPYRKLLKALAAAQKGTLGNLTRYIANRGSHEWNKPWR
jgi:hypothetical protein